jgi:ribonuclease HI
MILSFGKYRNNSIDEVLKKDIQYIKWLITQPWFAIKHRDMYLLLTDKLTNYDNIKNNSFEIKSNGSNIISDSFIIYTDGACKNNGSKNAKAGIGVYFSKRNNIKINDISKKLLCDKPTNNKAELTAILAALEKCYEKDIKQNIIIYTDSDYCIKCITCWYPEWIKQPNFNKKKNIDILNKIFKYYNENKVKLIHIRSHTGLQDEHSIGNESADKLATSCI